jgi:hypothetical protein
VHTLLETKADLETKVDFCEALVARSFPPVARVSLRRHTIRRLGRAVDGASLGRRPVRLDRRARFRDSSLRKPSDLVWQPVVSGLALRERGVCLIFRFKFGMFWLYFINHNQYPHDTPIVSTLPVLTDLIRNAGENERLTFLWYAFGLTVVGLRVPKVHREPSFWFVVLMLVFFPANGTWVGLYRYYVLGLPLFVLLGAAECAGWLKGAYLVLGILLQFGVLYPKYIAGHLI